MKNAIQIQPYESFKLAPVENANISSEIVSFRKKKWDKVKETCLEWSLRSNLDSFVKIFEYKDNLFAKFIWGVILFFLSGITFWSISKIILEYFNYEVVSKIQVIYENPTKFPTITICDNNPFTTIQSQPHC